MRILAQRAICAALRSKVFFNFGRFLAILAVLAITLIARNYSLVPRSFNSSFGNPGHFLN